MHVPSPDWRDQVIYFVLTDRFADGATANNDQGDPAQRSEGIHHWTQDVADCTDRNQELNFQM